MSVCSIKEKLATEKAKLMKQTTFTEMFTKALRRNAMSARESTSDTQVLRSNDDNDTNNPPSAW